MPDSNIPIIEIQNLRKIYHVANGFALNNINIIISKNEFLGLLGPNGAGKTTLISILTGILGFDEGQVSINGLDIRNHSNEVKGMFGLVPQDIALYQTLTIKENLEYFGSMYGLKGSVLKSRIDECFEVTQLDAHANKKVIKCSGGIKRRANLAVGLLHNPQLLILDEPTVSVDAQSRNLIFEYLKVLNEKGTTIIYTTHYITEAETLCKRINIIDNGSIIADGSPAELIQSNRSCRDLGEVFLKLTGKILRD